MITSYTPHKPPAPTPIEKVRIDSLEDGAGFWSGGRRTRCVALDKSATTPGNVGAFEVSSRCACWFKPDAMVTPKAGPWLG